MGAYSGLPVRPDWKGFEIGTALLKSLDVQQGYLPYREPLRSYLDHNPLIVVLPKDQPILTFYSLPDTNHVLG